MNNLVLRDTAEVYLKDLSDNSVYFLGLTSKADISQKIQQEILRGGIGNGIVGMLQYNKEIDFTVTTLLHADDIIAIESGAKQISGTYTVQANEKLQLSGGKLTLTGTPSGSNVIVIDSTGKQITATYDTATKTVTVTGGTDGDYYTVIYPTSVTGSAIPLDTSMFPKNYYVELHSIAVDPDTNTVAADVYWIFNKAVPDGSMSVTHEAGKNNGDTIKFVAMTPINSTSIGQYIIVPRAS